MITKPLSSRPRRPSFRAGPSLANAAASAGAPAAVTVCCGRAGACGCCPARTGLARHETRAPAASATTLAPSG